MGQRVALFVDCWPFPWNDTIAYWNIHKLILLLLNTLTVPALNVVNQAELFWSPSTNFIEHVFWFSAIHKNENGAFYANVKTSEGYRKEYIPENKIYELTRYYKTSEFNPEFSRTIATVKATTDKELKPFYLVLYKWASGKSKEFFLPRHGNA